MAGLDPAICRDTKVGASRAPLREPRVIAGSSPAMTMRGESDAILLILLTEGAQPRSASQTTNAKQPIR